MLLSLLLCLTPVHLDAQPVVGVRVNLHSAMRAAIVELNGEFGQETRGSVDGSGPETIGVIKVNVIEKEGREGSALECLVGRANSKLFRSLRGRYALVYAAYPTLMGPKREFKTQPGDALGFAAIRVPNSFRLKPSESVRVFCYRALASSWKELSPSDLESCIKTAMPSPAPEEAIKGSATYAADSRLIADLALNLEPVRRTVVLTELFEARQWEAGAALAQSIWQMRNAPEMNSITLPGNLNSGGELPRISTKELHFNAEGSQCDAVRALYIRSLPMDGTVDYPRLARLLKNSEKRALHELVLALSNHKKDPAWNYRGLSPEQQQEQLQSFVQHWIAVFSVA